MSLIGLVLALLAGFALGMSVAYWRLASKFSQARDMYNEAADWSRQAERAYCEALQKCLERRLK